jgi:hypothetical protein
MEWLDFEKDLVNKHIYTINNNSTKNIVLFGSCHMATIGFMINKLLDYNFNIHIIISWFFQIKGIENFDMVDINNKIKNVVSNCDVFIYHMHINDYHVDASILPSLVNDNCLKLIVPNYRLDYLDDNYSNSLHILNHHIENSDFQEFKFVTENHKNIMFFNTPYHPTHYLLFLQSKSIKNKIAKNGKIITIESYFDDRNRSYFKKFKEIKKYYVNLPGINGVDEKISLATGINTTADYFDLL